MNDYEKLIAQIASRIYCAGAVHSIARAVSLAVRLVSETRKQYNEKEGES